MSKIHVQGQVHLIDGPTLAEIEDAVMEWVEKNPSTTSGKITVAVGPHKVGGTLVKQHTGLVEFAIDTFVQGEAKRKQPAQAKAKATTSRTVKRGKRGL